MAEAALAHGETWLERLRARRPELEEAILSRVYAIDDPTGDVEYVRGLRETIRVALDHAIGLLEGKEVRWETIQSELFAQARLAARNGVSIDTVLRRYFAGHTLYCDYLLHEVDGREGLSAADLQQALRAEAALFDQVVAGVTDAYRDEFELRHHSSGRRRAEQVKRLLAGEPLDPLDLGYGLDLWHLGVVAIGADAPHALRELAAALDRQLLLARPGGSETWAWLGGTRKMPAEDLVSQASRGLRSELLLAVGDPGRGVSGWRLTHRQAKAALPVGVRGRSQVVSYSQVAIVASALGDEVLVSSLIETYLVPLANERDGGATLRKTLRAYFAAGRNVASAAAALGVSRQTTARRLNAVENRLGRTLETCGAEVETALRLWDLSHPMSVLQ